MWILALGALGSNFSEGQVFTNLIRQVQINSNAEWDVPVAKVGQQQSPLPINPGGARFELWTLKSSTAEEFLIDQRYVGSYVPQGTVTIESEDPYVTVMRTRADRPFRVRVNVAQLLTDPSAPEASRKIRLIRHVQAYGNEGNEATINRDNATVLVDTVIDENGDYVYDYSLSSLPGVDRSKLRGEERFTLSTLRDYQGPTYDIPPFQVAGQYIQIWPVADGTITGMEDGDSIRFQSPTLTLTLNDLYPESRTYAQIYKGPPVLGTVGTPVPGSAIVFNDAVPHDRVLVLDQWDSVIDESGQWTMELLTETPFGIDRLDTLTFNINRDIQVNGTVTTVEN